MQRAHLPELSLPVRPARNAVHRTAGWALIGLLLAFSSLLGAQDALSPGIILREVPIKQSINTICEDHDGFLWIGTGEGLFRYDGFEVDPMAGPAEDVEDIGAMPIYSVLEDSLRHLWVLSRSGLYIFSPDRQAITKLSLTDLGIRSLEPLSRLQYVNGEMWIFSGTAQVLCFALPDAGSATPAIVRRLHYSGFVFLAAHPFAPDRLLLETDNRKRYMIADAQGRELEVRDAARENAAYFWHPVQQRMFAMASPDLYTLDPKTAALTPEKTFFQLFFKAVPCTLSDSRRQPDLLWIGTTLGHLVSYSSASGHYQDYTGFLANRLYEGRFFRIQTLLEGREGGLWIGTNQGLAYLQVPDNQYFRHLPKPRTRVSDVSYSTRALHRMDDGSLLVSSYAGLFRYYPDGHIREYQVWNDVDQRFVVPLVYDFMPERNRIWMASEGNGILYYDMARDTLLRTASSASQQGINEGDLFVTKWTFSILRDHTGQIWTGTSSGLFLWHEVRGYERAAQLPETNKQMRKVFDIVEDGRHVLWLATATGLYSVNARRDSITHHPTPHDSRAAVQCIHLGAEGAMWIGTRGKGLWEYDPDRDISRLYTMDDGLPDNTIGAIESAGNGELWISTHNGLSHFDIRLRHFRNFFIEDGLLDNEFNHASSFRDANGRLYFGGVSGVIYFDPATTGQVGQAGTLRITKVLAHDGRHGRTLQHLYNSNHQPTLTLGYRDKYFTIFYATGSPVPNARETFAYKLTGLHDDWQHNGEKNSIQFTGLSPSRYTLQIRSLSQPASDTDHLLTLPILVERPFFQQWWAYLLYVLVLGGTAFLIFREYFRRKHIDRQLQLEIDHKARLEEINRSKSTFFTNITHEFKTPLTLIQGPAEEIARASPDPMIVRQAKLISKNARSILALVNQLLDLGKLEANLDAPKFYRLDLVAHIRIWLEPFAVLARQKEIKLGLYTEEPSLYVDFDPVKLETVFNNLLSNAIKFTPSGGRVTCSLHTAAEPADRVMLTVEDTGPGIPAQEQERVFERFYQGSNSVLGGTGIGLAFVREMVRVHGGQVELESTPGEGSRFIVSLPVYQAEVQDTGIKAAPPDETSLPEMMIDERRDEDDKAVILVVEDHADVAALIRDVLGKQHHILLAPNGRDGHREAVEHIPDLIITDVMMPVMDGYALTHLIRQDIHTSHIPIVMLTAKDGEASRIEGRSHGADVYLEKPFSVRELELTVRNLLLLKQRMAERAAGQAQTDVRAVELGTDEDQTFYRQFLAVVEEFLSEPDLSVEDFTTRLGISRTQLHRKLKAVSGMSVNQIVRNMRLQRALPLLRESGRTIAEVAYQVGFSSPSYFTERFREHYGYPPSEVTRPGSAG